MTSRSPDEAFAALERERRQEPDNAETHNGLGNVRLRQGDLGEAIGHFQRALQLRPNDPEAYYGLARALVEQRRMAEAVLCYRQALRLKPDLTGALKGLGDLLRRMPLATVDEVLACYREAIRLKPDDALAYDKLGAALKDAGLLDEAIAAFRRACDLRPDSAPMHSRLLDCLHFHPDYDSAMLAREHEHWNKRHAAHLVPVPPAHTNIPDPDRRLRIGYASPNFSRHPVGRFLLTLLRHHDRGSFEVFCYASVLRPDGFTREFRAQSDVWKDTTGMSDERLATLIREDQIDILVDPDCHTPGNRLLSFARKPAPVQVSYLAYCSTTGMPAVDYRLTDQFLDPVEEPRFYAEESVWLPETYWCYEPLPGVPTVGPLPALASGRVTFGCLNSFYKITLPTLTVWRDLLREVPRARLLLHAKPGSQRDRVRSFFAAGDVDPGRIEFAGTCPPMQYFERYQEIDIGLDPFPYAGGTTTCDALWMGVPVITLAGKTAVARAGASLLSNVGLPSLVAPSPAAYIRLCADLAADLPRLAAVRSGLRDRMRDSPLGDAPRFARHVEAAFRTMWRRWCDR